MCNLAAAFGFESDRVLLIDADLRQPAVGEYLGIAPPPGLSTVLLGECRPGDAIQSCRDGLFDVLASGPVPKNPSELLGSKQFNAMLAEFKSQYDVVLVDSPALLPVADGSVLARACDAALLVVTYGRTPAAHITDALAALRAASARVLGCAFFKAPQSVRANRAGEATVGSYTTVATADTMGDGKGDAAASHNGRSHSGSVSLFAVSSNGTTANHEPPGQPASDGPDR